VYKLPEETINKVLAYLGKQPYEQVHILIAEIQQKVEKVDTISKDKKKKSK